MHIVYYYYNVFSASTGTRCMTFLGWAVITTTPSSQKELLLVYCSVCYFSLFVSSVCLWQQAGLFEKRIYSHILAVWINYFDAFQEYCATKWTVIQDKYRHNLYPRADRARLKLVTYFVVNKQYALINTMFLKHIIFCIYPSRITNYVQFITYISQYNVVTLGCIAAISA